MYYSLTFLVTHFTTVMGKPLFDPPCLHSFYSMILPDLPYNWTPVYSYLTTTWCYYLSPIPTWSSLTWPNGLTFMAATHLLFRLLEGGWMTLFGLVRHGLPLRYGLLWIWLLRQQPPLCAFDPPLNVMITTWNRCHPLPNIQFYFYPPRRRRRQLRHYATWR
jgi:hypothetical protein